MFWAVSAPGGWSASNYKTSGLKDVQCLYCNQIGNGSYTQQILVTGIATSTTISMSFTGTSNNNKASEYRIIGEPIKE